MAVALPLALGFIGASGSNNAVCRTWYQDLSVPLGRPPRGVLPFIWNALYAAMGYASHLAIRHHDDSISYVTKQTIQVGYVWYYLLWVFNLIRSPTPPNLETPSMVFGDAIASAVLTLHTTKLFHDGTDGATTPFLIPYCAWMCVVVYINGGIYWLNRGQDLPYSFG